MGNQKGESSSSRVSKHHGGKKSQAEKKKPSKPSGSGSDKKERPSIRTTTEQGGSGSSSSSFSFLFVVNCLMVRDDAAPAVDQWGCRMPPESTRDYDAEAPGAVYRYCDGVVERAGGYEWERPYEVHPVTGLMPEGGIHLVDSDGVRWPMPEYKRFTVFNCWGPLPCVYTRGDVLSTLMGRYGDGGRWHVMSFTRNDSTGVTRISEAGNSQIVAGRNPSWIPSLVPKMFQSAGPGTPISRGLSGELAVIIGQMALTEAFPNTDRPFAAQWWHRGHWNPKSPRLGFRDPLDLRGVLVVICLDSYQNEGGSTEESLRDFEQRGVIVKE